MGDDPRTPPALRMGVGLGEAADLGGCVFPRDPHMTEKRERRELVDAEMHRKSNHEASTLCSGHNLLD